MHCMEDEKAVEYFKRFLQALFNLKSYVPSFYLARIVYVYQYFVQNTNTLALTNYVWSGYKILAFLMISI